MTSMERAAVGVVPWMLAGSAAALPLLAVPPPDDPLVLATVHLGAVVAFGLVLAQWLAPLADDSWFAGTSLGAYRRLLASAVGMIVLVTGTVGVVTLATGAALRLAPSLQFLQLLGALDIAWVVAAVVVGVRRRLGAAAAWGAGVVVIGVCVWSIWRYLDAVGFTPEGGWRVDASELVRLVLPFDVIAALVAVAAVVAGSRVDHRIEHPRAQS